MTGKLTTWLTCRGNASLDGLHLRGWFVCFVLVMLALAGAALWGLQMERGGCVWAEKVWLSALYVFYMALCCSFFPAPTAWIVLLMASPVLGLFDANELALHWGLSEQPGQRWAAFLTVSLVAALGAAGTMLANLNEYHLFSFLLRFGSVARIRETRLYAAAKRYFEVSPFMLMTAVSFLPIPVDMIRWLAITNRYRRDHFALASFLGRFVRYALLACTAFYLQFGAKEIVLLQFGFIGLAALRYVPRLWSVKREKTSAAAVSCEAGNWISALGQVEDKPARE